MSALTDLHALFITQMNLLLEASANSLNATEEQLNPGTRDMITIQEACKSGLLLLMGNRLGFWPEHDRDFRGISFAGAAKTIRAIGIPGSFCMTTPDGIISVDLSGCNNQFSVLLGCLESREWKLGIDDFRSRFRTPRYTY